MAIKRCSFPTSSSTLSANNAGSRLQALVISHPPQLNGISGSRWICFHRNRLVSLLLTSNQVRRFDDMVNFRLISHFVHKRHQLNITFEDVQAIDALNAVISQHATPGICNSGFPSGFRNGIPSCLNHIGTGERINSVGKVIVERSGDFCLKFVTKSHITPSPA
nr:MAG TPA: hypothetical protein [Caudoviricetes sp.]